MVMGSKGNSEYRALQRERERRRRQQQARAAVGRPPLDSAEAKRDFNAPARRTAATTCGWCHGTITPQARGPIRKWCSATRRHRAWEQRRAAASGRSAVEILERVVTVAAPPQAAQPTPRQLAWVELLRRLAVQVEQGTVYAGTWPPSPRRWTTPCEPCTGVVPQQCGHRLGGHGGDTAG